MRVRSACETSCVARGFEELCRFVAVVEPMGRLTDRIGLGVLTWAAGLNLVDEVLVETGRVEKRQQLLPARVVVYFVLAMILPARRCRSAR